MQTIGQRIRKYRTDRGISQYDLADGICSPSTISQVESDKFVPSVEIMRKLADRLSIPFHEITVTQERQLEVKVQLEIIKVYIETEEYPLAVKLIEELEYNGDLVEHQMRELIINRAECLMRMGDVEQSLKILTELQIRLEKERETDDHLMATLYNKIGNAHYLTSNLINAYANYVRAYQISLRFPEVDYLSAYISYNLGNVCRTLGFHADALQHIKNANKFFKNTLDFKKLAHTMFALGMVYRNLNQVENATEYLQRSLALYESQKIMDLAQRVRQHYAFCVLAQEEPEIAVQELLDVAKEFEKIGDQLRVATSYARVASVYMDQSQLSDAERYIHLAMSLLDEKSESDSKCAFIYQIYAKILLQMNQLETSATYSIKASEILNHMGFEMEAVDTLQVAVQTYTQLGAMDKALEMSQKANSILREALCRRQNHE